MKKTTKYFLIIIIISTILLGAIALLTNNFFTIMNSEIINGASTFNYNFKVVYEGKKRPLTITEPIKSDNLVLFSSSDVRYECSTKSEIGTSSSQSPDCFMTTINFDGKNYNVKKGSMILLNPHLKLTVSDITSYMQVKKTTSPEGIESFEYLGIQGDRSATYNFEIMDDTFLKEEVTIPETIYQLNSTVPVKIRIYQDLFNQVYAQLHVETQNTLEDRTYSLAPRKVLLTRGWTEITINIKADKLKKSTVTPTPVLYFQSNGNLYQYALKNPTSVEYYAARNIAGYSTVEELSQPEKTIMPELSVWQKIWNWIKGLF